MGRSRASSKAAGTNYETKIARYLAAETGKPIIRMPKTGAMDKGDIFGLMFHNNHIAVECKSPGQDQGYKLSQWMRETAAETLNSGSVAGILLVKRFRKPVEDSLCVLTEKHAEILGLDPEKMPIRRTQGYNKWWDYITEDIYSRFPIRGEKGNFYVATSLRTIVNIFDKHKEDIEITLTSKQIQDLIQNKTVIVDPYYPGMPTITVCQKD